MSDISRLARFAFNIGTTGLVFNSDGIPEVACLHCNVRSTSKYDGYKLNHKKGCIIAIAEKYMVEEIEDV